MEWTPALRGLRFRTLPLGSQVHAMLSLLLPLLLWCGLASAGEQRVVYDLQLDGATVGKRELTLRYLQTSSGEVRILETWTELTVTVAGATHTLKSRATAKAGGTPAFSNAIEQDGQLREIQGRLLPDRRWMVTLAEGGNIKTWYYRGSEITLSSLDLLDPRRHLLLLDKPTAFLLAAETGVVTSGATADLGARTLTIGGSAVDARCASFTPETGPMELCWSEEGLLLSYETSFLGREIVAIAREVPTPATFGIIDAPALQQGGTMSEEPL